MSTMVLVTCIGATKVFCLTSLTLARLVAVLPTLTFEMQPCNKTNLIILELYIYIFPSFPLLQHPSFPLFRFRLISTKKSLESSSTANSKLHIYIGWPDGAEGTIELPSQWHEDVGNAITENLGATINKLMNY